MVINNCNESNTKRLIVKFQLKFGPIVSYVTHHPTFVWIRNTPRFVFMKMWRVLQSSWKCVACYSINYNIRHHVITSKGKRKVCFFYTVIMTTHTSEGGQILFVVHVQMVEEGKKLVGISWETFHTSDQTYVCPMCYNCMFVWVTTWKRISTRRHPCLPHLAKWRLFCLLFFYGISCQDKTPCLTSHLKHTWDPNYKNQLLGTNGSMLLIKKKRSLLSSVLVWFWALSWLELWLTEQII